MQAIAQDTSSTPNPLMQFITRYPTISAIMVLSLLWILFFWRFLTPNIDDRQIIPEGDFTVQFYSNADYQVERIQDGQIPLWNPYNYGGETFAGNLQVGAWYPPRWVSAVLWGDTEGWTLEAFTREVIAHYWLASIFMYGFLQILTKKSLPALGGAIVFTYGGYLTSYPMQQLAILEGAIWLPFMLMGIHLSVTNTKWRLRGMVISAVGLTFAVLAGHPQTIMQVGYMTLGYLIFVSWQTKLHIRGIFWRIGLLGLLTLGLGMIQLLPSLEFTLHSSRLDAFAYDEKSAGLTVSSFAQTILPTLYGVWSPLYVGVLALLLGMYGFIKPEKKHIFWICIIVASLFLSLGRESFVFDVFYLLIPGFNLFRQQERIAILIVFAVAVLTAYQLHALTIEANYKRFQRLISIFTGVLALLFISVTAIGLVNNTPETNTINVIGFTAFIGLMITLWLYWGQSLKQTTVITGLIVIIVIDLFSITTQSANFVADIPENRTYLPISLQEYGVNDHNYQWRVDGAAGVRGYNTLFRIPDMYGVSPILLETTEALRHLPVDRYWEIFSVRYVTAVEEPPDFVPMELLAYEVNTVGEEFRIFELQDPRPMAQLVYDYRHGEGSAEFARQIMADSRVNLREMAVTTNPLEFELPIERPENASVTNFIWETPESVSMIASTDDTALLTLSIPNYPGWRAYVNDEQVEIVDVYAGLIGIPIEAGDNQHVRLNFTPMSVIFGAFSTGTTLIIASILIIFELMRNRKVINDPSENTV